MSGLLALVGPLTRDDARAAARRELSKGLYARERPNLVERAVRAVVGWVGGRVREVLDVTPGGGLGFVALLVLVVVALALLRARLGPLRRAATGPFDLDAGGPRPSTELRAEAERLAARGAWAEAVRARLRALVRTLEERDVVEPRPGRTAAEVAAQAGRALPELAGALREAVGVFDEVWYGGQRAGEQSYRRVAVADERLARARLPAPAEAGPGFPAPA